MHGDTMLKTEYVITSVIIVLIVGSGVGYIFGQFSIEEYKSDIERLETENLGLRRKVEEQQGEHTFLRGQLTKVTEELSSTQSCFQDLNTSYEVLKEDYEILEEKYKVFEKEVTNLISQLETLNDTYTYLLLHSVMFEVSDLFFSSDEVEIGQPVSISLTIKNAGTLKKTYPLLLKIDGVIEAAREVILFGGENTTISFDIINNEIKTYNVTLNGLSGSFKVIEPPTQHVWVVPVDATASGYTKWGGTWYTGPPHLAIDGNEITAWTLNGIGEIIFDLGSEKVVEGINAYWGGHVTNGNTVNVYVDGTQVLSNEQFGATSNIRYFEPIHGRFVKYQTVALPHNEYLQIATWSEIAEFKVLVEQD